VAASYAAQSGFSTIGARIDNAMNLMVFLGTSKKFAAGAVGADPGSSSNGLNKEDESMKRMNFTWVLTAAVSAMSLAACSGASPEPVDQAPQAELAHAAAPNAAPAANSSEANAAPVAGERGHRHDKGEFLKRLDANSDGKVELSEVPERMRDKLAAADTNHDGVLSAEELKAHAQAARQERFARMDKNQDGALSADEVGEKRWSHLQAADADHDGKVTQAELKQAFENGTLKPFKHGGHGHGAPSGTEAPAGS
jgi:Ca2+-binding EF-hand superfamily protein